VKTRAYEEMGRFTLTFSPSLLPYGNDVINVIQIT